MPRTNLFVRVVLLEVGMDGSSRRKTCVRYDNPGDAHFLTFSCIDRRPLLTDDQTAQWMIEAIDNNRSKGLFDLWAYVVMPEHVHLVIRPNDADISDILKRIKQSVARRVLRNRLDDALPGHFWQAGGGYDRNLRSSDDVQEKIDYVHANLVKRGLVERSTDWPWSSARCWLEGSEVPIPVNRDTCPVRLSE